MKSHVLRLSPVQARALDKRPNNRILTSEDLRLLQAVRAQLDGVIEAIDADKVAG